MTEQQRYQVRLDWAAAGARAVADDADIVIWVDAIGATRVPVEAIVAAAPDVAIATSTLRTARAAAEWAADRQAALGRRLTIAVIAAGAPRDDAGDADATGDADGADSDAAAPRFAAEDLLAAGAVIDRLGRRGIDATSPEAAVAQAAWRGLERAVGHLMTASVSAAALAEPIDHAERSVDDTLTAADATVLRG